MAVPDMQVDVENVIRHLKAALSEAQMDRAILLAGLDFSRMENLALHRRITELETAVEEEPPAVKAPVKTPLRATKAKTNE